MDINRLTEKAQEALRAAQSEATRLGHQQIDVEHVLLALVQQEGGLTRSILEKTGIDTGYDPVYGARPLKRMIQKELETPIGRRLLSGEIHDGDKIIVNWKEGEFTFATKGVARAAETVGANA